jgi:chromosome segregation ATPase
LHAQKTELMRMMGELRSMQDSIRQQAKPDVRALQQEVERLSRENADVVVLREDNLRLQLELETARQHDAGSDVPDDFVRQLDDLRAEINLLTEELRTKEASLQELQQRPAGDQHHDVEQLRAENALLKQLLEERSTEPAPRAEPQLPKSESDLELYETELNEYRRQLDTDRNKLNREVETLRERNKELDEAIREMEMEMSKERAELARERMRLERVREEVKADMERMQRESSVRDSMGPVQRLREEIAGKNGKGGNDRLRTIRDLPK